MTTLGTTPRRARLAQLSSTASPLALVTPNTPPPGNDGTKRNAIWREFPGDTWQAYDALPPSVRQRLQEHAYDAWTVNALILWRLFRRQTGSSARAERRLLRYLNQCEDLERAHFARLYAQRYGAALPHSGAQATVLRYATEGPG